MTERPTYVRYQNYQESNEGRFVQSGELVELTEQEIKRLPYYQDNWLTLYNGDCREVLKGLPDESVNCVVTSPPYFGLRDYGCAGQIGLEQTPEDYIEQLVKVFQEVRRVLRSDGILFLNPGDSYFGSGKGETGHNGIGDQTKRQGFKSANTLRERLYGNGDKVKSSSQENGLSSQNLDDERISYLSSHIADIYDHRVPKQVVESSLKILACTEELRDHLHSEGSSRLQPSGQSLTTIQDLLHSVIREYEPLLSFQVSTQIESSLRPSDYSPLWDSFSAYLLSLHSFYDYALLCVGMLDGSLNSPDYMYYTASLFEGLRHHIQCTLKCYSIVCSYSELRQVQPSSSIRLKPKDLIGIPWLAAFALRADGWYLRQDIIWHKLNPMPESVTDRCTKAHEYVFLLSKSQSYYYNADAIKEPCSPNTHARISQDLAGQVGSFRANGGNKTNGPMKAVIAGSTRKIAESGSGIANNKSYEAARALVVADRNKRSVWTVATKSYSEAHFATFPPDLIRPCILAGCPVGGVVLDPFIGSGTTAQVAREAQCKSVGIEVNADYCKLIEKRLQQGAFDFNEADS